jgi:hypothetical protein
MYFWYPVQIHLGGMKLGRHGVFKIPSFAACDVTLKANFQSGKLSVDWNGQEKFLCVKVISSNPELPRQRKIYLSVPIHG